MTGIIDVMTEGFVCLAKLADLGSAQVAAARLASEGIETRLHGEALGPFPVTVGGLAITQVWVQADQAQPATEILTELGIECEVV